MDYAKSYKWVKGYRCPCGERRSMARRRRSEMEYSLIATEPDGSKWVMIEESERIIADLKAELRAKENTIKSKNKLIEKLVEQLAAAQERTMAIRIIFDGPPGPDAGQFVEVETDTRESISIGEWIDRKDGYWALRIAKLPAPPEQEADHDN